MSEPPSDAATPSTRLYSCGNTLTNFGSSCVPIFQDPVGARAAGLLRMARDPVAQRFDVLGVVHRFQIDAGRLQRVLPNSPVSSSTNAIPPVMPAAKFLPVSPSTITKPLVMYSQP